LTFIIRIYYDARSSECQIILDIYDAIANEDVACRVQCALFTSCCFSLKNTVKCCLLEKYY